MKNLFKPRYYFVLHKWTGHSRKLSLAIELVMYEVDGKFKTTYQLYESMLLTLPQAIKYKFLFWFNGIRGNNEKMFFYSRGVKGSVILKKLF